VLYEAYHEIQPVIRRESKKMVVGDVVGPVCESGDFLALERELPEVDSGDLLAVMSAGAYGFVMASNYNSRPRSPELLINGAEVHVIRERDSFEDIVRNEKIVTLAGGPDA
jgi:diaminopimelate decarboxylase